MRTIAPVRICVGLCVCMAGYLCSQAQCDEPSAGATDTKADDAALLASRFSERVNAGEDRREVACELFDQVALERAGIDDLRAMFDVLYWAATDGDRAERIYTRLDELAGASTHDGARAAVLSVRLTPRMGSEDAQGEALRRGVTHAGIGRVMETTEGTELLRMIRAWAIGSPEVIQAVQDDLMIFGQSLPEGTHEQSLYEVTAIPFALKEVDPDDIFLDQRERVLERCAQLVSDQMRRHAEGTRERRALASVHQMLMGPGFRASLVGNPAPTITFDWCSDPELTSLADLRGRVVVLDFWSTACLPCVAAFPDLRDLHERYEGQPVTIVGITSLQGVVLMPEGPVRTNDVALEHKLMHKYMDRKSVTWTIAFSDDRAAQQAYGITKIPVITIVDQAGNLRFHNVKGKDKVAECINALLAEAERARASHEEEGGK